SHAWKGPYNNLSIKWFGEGRGGGNVLVHVNGKQGSVPYAVPNPQIPVSGSGVLFNAANRSIVFTLSNNPIPDNPITDNTRS
ncbi:MAG TPA: hypothetical protein VNZ44_17990, partial [Pyrinomonadaceae bacterium]|nr:hypothetical protein [Pyrinomonadaceae bacterium]